jgi:hypothetical protein
MICGELLSKTKWAQLLQLAENCPKKHESQPQNHRTPGSPHSKKSRGIPPEDPSESMPNSPESTLLARFGKSNLNSIHGHFRRRFGRGIEFPKQRGFIPRRFYPADDLFRKLLAVP